MKAFNIKNNMNELQSDVRLLSIMGSLPPILVFILCLEVTGRMKCSKEKKQRNSKQKFGIKSWQSREC